MARIRGWLVKQSEGAWGASEATGRFAMRLYLGFGNFACAVPPREANFLDSPSRMDGSTVTD